MIDRSASGLVQSVSFELLDRQRRSLNALDGVLSMAVERSVFSSPREGGSLELNLRQADVNLLTMSIRPWVTMKLGNEEEHYPLCTTIPQIITPERRTTASARFSLKLLDYTRLLDVPLGVVYSVAPGDIVTTKVREILFSVGVMDAAITESSGSVVNGTYWAPVETKRKVVNDLLDSLGFGAIHADAWGQLQVGPYQRPSDRPVSPNTGFVHGLTCTYSPEFTIEHDISNVPNHAVLVSRADRNEEPIVAEAWLPAAHPNSVENRAGLEIPYTEDGVDLAVPPLPESPTQQQIDDYNAARQAALNLLANKRLQDRANPSRTFQVTNRWSPIPLGTVARFKAPSRGLAPVIECDAVVVSDSVRYEAGGTLKTTTVLQEVFR